MLTASLNLPRLTQWFRITTAIRKPLTKWLTTTSPLWLIQFNDKWAITKGIFTSLIYCLFKTDRRGEASEYVWSHQASQRYKELKISFYINDSSNYFYFNYLFSNLFNVKNLNKWYAWINIFIILFHVSFSFHV